MQETKICTKCKRKLPATSEYFYKHPAGKDGFCASCKECKKEYDKKRNQLIDYKLKESREEKKEENSLYNKEYRQRNKEKIKIQRSEWRKNNAEGIRISKQRRRAKKKELPATLTEKQWSKIKQQFNNCCAYCGTTEKEHLKLTGERLHQEHFVSIGNGGDYTHNNIIPSCRTCNSSKGELVFGDWYPAYKHYDRNKEKKILDFLGYGNEEEQQLTLIL